MPICVGKFLSNGRTLTEKFYIARWCNTAFSEPVATFTCRVNQRYRTICFNNNVLRIPNSGQLLCLMNLRKTEGLTMQERRSLIEYGRYERISM